MYVLEAAGEVAEFVVGHYCGRGLNLERFADCPVQLANWAHQADQPEQSRTHRGLPKVALEAVMDRPRSQNQNGAR